LKKHYLPYLYWQMLRGRPGLDWHTPRAFPAAVPTITP